MYTVSYHVSVSAPHRKLIDLEATFPTEGAETLKVNLAAWRPGRYELANFSRKILTFGCVNEHGIALQFQKCSKEQWEIDCRQSAFVTIRYRYYADELNGGSTWVDDQQVYINPVNCFLFRPDRPDARAEITLHIPDDWSIASGMPQLTRKKLTAEGVQQLMDSPFIAAKNIQHHTFQVRDYRFHLWVVATPKLDLQRMADDFAKYTEAQINAFGDFPVSEYHYLLQFPDHPTRHGVEHENATVITLGPVERLFTDEGYRELLGIACHELYHTWNVKSIRPLEMMPYDFTRENYSRLGFVTEGVTTYFGDLYLLRAGVITSEAYLKLLSNDLMRHLHNPGRLNMSVAESSFDTWVDGYTPGIPNRKVSIYTEGCIAALVTDAAIRHYSQGQHTLDDVMRNMYVKFGKTQTGYTELDYRLLVEEAAGKALDDVFDQLIYGTADSLPFIEQALNRLGVELTRHANTSIAGKIGALGQLEAAGYLVNTVWPGSPADHAQIAPGDRIIAINGVRLEHPMQMNLAHFKGDTIELHLLRFRQIRKTTCALNGDYFPKITLQISAANPERFGQWSMQPVP